MNTNSYCVFLCAALLVSGAAFGQQQIRVSGLVTDASNGESLIAATVICGVEGAVSDADGHYSITIKGGESSISFHYAGYVPRTVDVKFLRDTVINVALEAGERINAAHVVAENESGFHSSHIDAVDIPLETVRTMPVILGEPDVLKAVQLMPGVQGGMEGFSGIYVRGGGADENLFLLDGVPLYNVSHLLGIFSAFTPEAIKKVTLYKGAFPARYGGRVSGVLDLRMMDGDTYKTNGSASVGLISSKIHLNGPLVKGRTTYAFTGRLMHTAALAPFINMSDNAYSYYFYDLTGKIVHRISGTDRLFLSLYHGNDVFGYHGLSGKSSSSSETTEDKLSMDWGNTVAALRWNHVFGNGWTSNTSLAYNRYGMNTGTAMTRRWEAYVDKRLQDFAETYDSRYASAIHDASLAFDVSCSPSNSHAIKTGLSVIYHYYSPRTRFARTDEIKSEDITEITYDRTYSGIESAVYVEDEIRLTSRVAFNPGLRFVLMTSGSRVYFSAQPRLSGRVDIGHGFAFKAGYARMGQYVHQLSSTRLTLPSDLWVPITEKIKPVTSDIVSAGLFYDGVTGLELSVESYFKFSHNVIDYREGASMFGTSEGWDEMVEMGLARSYGVEFLARKTAGSLSGWLSYTLSKTERRYPDGYINSGNWFPYQYDRRHVVNLNMDYSISEKIGISATWSFASGGWTTIPERTTMLVNLVERNEDNRIGRTPFAVADYIPSRNNYNLPPSHTLSVAANFNRKLRRGERTISVSIYNVYNSMNPNLVFEMGRKAGETMVMRKITFLPILPALNYTYKF